MLKTYKYFRWLSLDVVMGAIFFLIYLDEFYKVNIPLAVYFALGAATWLIYTTDHLIDARTMADPSSPRHRFHKKHFRLLVLVAGLVLALALINIAILPEAVIRNGALLSAGCVGYLLVVFWFRAIWFKEILVAFAYAAGVFLAPLTLQETISFFDLLVVFQLVLIAFINLIIFSYYDLKQDQRDGFGSMVIRLGITKSGRLIHICCVLSILISVGAFMVTGTQIGVLYLLMSVILYTLFLLPQASQNERFRTIGDGVFYLPAIFIL